MTNDSNNVNHKQRRWGWNVTNKKIDCERDCLGANLRHMLANILTLSTVRLKECYQ